MIRARLLFSTNSPDTGASTKAFERPGESSWCWRPRTTSFISVLHSLPGSRFTWRSRETLLHFLRLVIKVRSPFKCRFPSLFQIVFYHLEPSRFSRNSSAPGHQNPDAGHNVACCKYKLHARFATAYKDDRRLNNLSEIFLKRASAGGFSFSKKEPWDIPI